VWTSAIEPFADLLFFRGHQVPSIGSPSTDEDFQSEGELDAHYGLAGPVAVAQEWMRLVLEESDLLSAWRLTDPDFRLAMTQALSGQIGTILTLPASTPRLPQRS
jgi:hypothetical protein